MKKSLLGGTALIGAAAMAGSAGAAEAPTWKLTGNTNFQFYYVDQDWTMMITDGLVGSALEPTTDPNLATVIQEHGWYFGVDESELQLNVSGTADNGLNYGFKIEINANTTDGTVADEARLQFSGGWGTLQMGDEDGAEDIMNYGGENLMGATGGFDGDFDDVLLRMVQHDIYNVGLGSDTFYATRNFVWGAPSYPTIAGDTSDATKISYFSPRFAGFQVGASLTPTPNNGDDFKADGAYENHYGIGANYDSAFGGVRVRASAVYSAATVNEDPALLTPTGDPWQFEDISAWSVGGIVGFGPVSIGANWTDNGESGQAKIWDDSADVFLSSGLESSYWNVAASFETGPLYLSAGYMSSTLEWGKFYSGAGLDDNLSYLDGPGASDEATFTTISLTADYTVAPGLGVYAEVDLIEDESGFYPNPLRIDMPDNSATIFIAGANVSF